MSRLTLLGGCVATAIATLLTPALGQESLRPIVLSPDHEHDRFAVLPRENVLKFRAYTASFDSAEEDNTGTSHWVAYELNAGSPIGRNERPDDWIPVPGVDNSPTDSSYRNSGFSRGHMCRRAHAHRLGADANFNTYCVANACPQLQGFNQGHWLGLEDFCSIWSVKFERIWVICGPIFDGGAPSRFIGDDGEVPVGIPDKFYKIVARDDPADPDRPLALGFIYEHSEELNDSGLDVDHSSFLRSIDEIEQATGLDFFTVLADEVEDEIESERAPAVWSIETEDGVESLLAAATQQRIRLEGSRYFGQRPNSLRFVAMQGSTGVQGTTENEPVADATQAPEALQSSTPIPTEPKGQPQVEPTTTPLQQKAIVPQNDAEPPEITAEIKEMIIAREVRNSRYLALAVVLLTVLSTGVVVWVMYMSGTYWNDITYKLLVINWAIGAGLFLIVAGFDKEQINPMMTLLGTIVGFVLGRRTSRDDFSSPGGDQSTRSPAPEEPQRAS